jgi:hypothetical protein
MTVDDYVEQNVLPEYRDLVAQIRAAMRSLAPEAEELISYAMPCYKGKQIFAYFNANKSGITLSFTHGVHFEDRYGLLRGAGKEARHIKMKSPADLDGGALEYYVSQALAIDAGRA